jgi:GNAT superfamily N-acetyltransferase
VDLEVRRARPEDERAVAQALSEAFASDPLVRFLFPDEGSRRRRVTAMFGLQLAAHYRALGAVWTTDGCDGAALWAPPDHWRFGTSTMLRSAPAMIRMHGRHLARALRYLSAVEARHPVEPHWYLGALGTRPAVQRRGIGSALLAPVLDRCDAEGLPAYLENSHPDNVAYYRRHGFQVTEELAPAGGPPVWLMWREPSR